MVTLRLSTVLVFLCPMLMASNCRKPPSDAVVTDGDITVQSPEVAVQVALVEPSYGPAGEAFDVEVIGSAFMQAARIQLGSNEAPRVLFLDENTLTATVPPLSVGSYDVTVINPDGSEATLRSALSIREEEPEVQCDNVVAYFGYDSDAVDDDAKAIIQAAVECMSQASGRIVLEGHTDERGTTRYNLSLGERRAEGVKRLVVGKGVTPNRVRSVSYGEEQPQDNGSGEAAWTKNRRVEIKLVDE